MKSAAEQAIAAEAAQRSSYHSLNAARGPAERQRWASTS